MNEGSISDNYLYEQETYLIRGAAFSVYKALGCWQKEKVYQKALAIILEKKGFKVEREKRIDIIFEGEKIGTYIPDFIINDIIIVELKAKKFISKEDLKQLWHYLKCSKYFMGVLLNFGAPGGIQFEKRVYQIARNITLST
jgi:GxxExxY protein